MYIVLKYKHNGQNSVDFWRDTQKTGNKGCDGGGTLSLTGPRGGKTDTSMCSLMNCLDFIPHMYTCYFILLRTYMNINFQNIDLEFFMPQHSEVNSEIMNKTNPFFLISQEPENKGDHSKVRIYTSPCMIQEHQETLKRLSEVWQKVSEQDDLIQELRNKLACSNALVSAFFQKIFSETQNKAMMKGKRKRVT